jgi:gluconate kinase
MGVSGCGKSTVAAALAAGLGWPFAEGDDLHPEANISKMAAGQPLTDADRAPWLAAIRSWIEQRLAAGEPGVLTCSALRRAYRDTLRGEPPRRALAGGGRPEQPRARPAETRDGPADDDPIVFVYLRGSREVLARRLAARRGHFMPAALLDSQLATLQEPGPDENALTVDVGPPAAETTRTVVERLGLDAAWRPAPPRPRD